MLQTLHKPYIEVFKTLHKTKRKPYTKRSTNPTQNGAQFYLGAHLRKIRGRLKKFEEGKEKFEEGKEKFEEGKLKFEEGKLKFEEGKF